MLKKFHRIAGKVRKEACEETEEEGAGAKRARRFEKFNKSCGFGANNFAPNGSVQDAKIRDQEPRTRTSAWKPRGFFFFFFFPQVLSFVRNSSRRSDFYLSNGIFLLQRWKDSRGLESISTTETFVIS